MMFLSFEGKRHKDYKRYTYYYDSLKQELDTDGFTYYEGKYLYFNPIDPNPAISAHVVFPQSGHIRPEKRPFFQNFPHFSKIEPYKK